MDIVKIINIVSIVCFICAAIFLIIGILTFIIFDVKGIINTLRGKVVEKQIEEIREKYSKSSSVRYEIDRINMNNMLRDNKNKTDKILTGSMEKTDEIISDDKTKEVFSKKNNIDKTNEIVTNAETDILSTETEVLSDSTEVLNNGTEVLGQETSVLYVESDNTDELTQEEIENGTVLLKEEDINIDTSFKIIKDIISINCEEVI